MVLWAPSIGIREDNVDKRISTLLEHASTATNISIDRNYLENLDMPTLIVLGTEDEVVDVSNSHVICDSLPRCELKLMRDSGHSFCSFDKNLSNNSVELLEVSK